MYADLGLRVGADPSVVVLFGTTALPYRFTYRLPVKLSGVKITNLAPVGLVTSTRVFAFIMMESLYREYCGVAKVGNPLSSINKVNGVISDPGID